ncbi:MAG: hypothetical protein JWN34_5693 [Bryobacterales bacterium]|nr:hypothetical protein [Bryobacterales bacterium]
MLHEAQKEVKTPAVYREVVCSVIGDWRLLEPGGITWIEGSQVVSAPVTDGCGSEPKLPARRFVDGLVAGCSDAS